MNTRLPASTLTSDRMGKGRASMPGRAYQDVSVVMCGCHVPVQGPENNIGRYRNSPLMHGAVLAQSKPTHGGVPVAFSAATKSIRFPRLRNFNLSRACPLF